jgi:tetratricopeptide (TPR) repeat protein
VGSFYLAIDAHYLLDDYKASYNHFIDALNCPDAQDNPFIHLRIGQNLYRLGDEDKAVDSFLKAYMLDGEEIFEEDGKKYLEFIKSKVNL